MPDKTEQLKTVPAFNELIERFPALKELKPALVQSMRSSAIRYAPTVMRDINVLGAWLTTVCQMEYLDLVVVQRLLDCERAYAQMRNQYKDPYLIETH
jgi:hypothetical protein